MSTLRSKVLLAIDDSRASARALRHVAGMVAREEAREVVLFHALPPTPPRFLEHGGGDTPTEEHRKETRLDHERAQWLESARSAAQPTLTRARAELRRHGLGENRIHDVYFPTVHAHDVAVHVLESARQLSCGTVVLGREACPWYREIAARHVADDVAEHAGGEMRVVVVGEHESQRAPSPQRIP